MPGSPDLVFPKIKTAVFVHGCFWHRHEGCKYCYSPKSRVEFWQEKFDNNIARDERVKGELERMGWRVATIWECETGDFDSLSTKLEALLDT
jgi:DNA mismatch endonuclease (patch repair protein)